MPAKIFLKMLFVCLVEEQLARVGFQQVSCCKVSCIFCPVNYQPSLDEEI